jgi:hypothetical protein
MNFREFLMREENTVGYHNDTATGAFLPTFYTGSEMPASAGISLQGRGLSLPGMDLVPTISRCCPITYVEKKKNPIFILLSDGTKLYFTWDEFKRIPGVEPETGRTLSVVFQRFPGDSSEQQSQIQSVKCY